MSGFARKIERQKEKEKIKDLHKTYGKKPKGICPKCKKHSLFYENQDKEIMCFRCGNIVALNK